MIAPSGPVYQAGTLCGNPLAMAAGIATLTALQQPGVWDELERRTAMLADGLGAAAKAAGVPYFGTRVGTMFCGFFTAGPVRDYATAKTSDTAMFGRFFHGMLQRGVYLAPSQYEAGFMSLAHTDAEIQQTIAGAPKPSRNAGSAGFPACVPLAGWKACATLGCADTGLHPVWRRTTIIVWKITRTFSIRNANLAARFAARISLTNAPRILETPHWIVEHGHPTEILGWLVLVLNRHCPAIHDLTAEELAALATCSGASPAHCTPSSARKRSMSCSSPRRKGTHMSTSMSSLASRIGRITLRESGSSRPMGSKAITPATERGDDASRGAAEGLHPRALTDEMRSCSLPDAHQISGFMVLIYF